MNSRVKTLVGLVVLGLAFCSASMTRADEISWSILNTDKIKIEKVSSGQGVVLSSYPAFLHRILTRVISWDPKKELNISTEAPIKNLNLISLLRNLSVEFDVSDTNQFRKVWFQLTPQLQVRGLIAVHDFLKPRPLVILRMGIHGNVDELLAERFIFKALYEDLNTNVLMLENLTSHAFVSQNAKMSFGGVEEGLHTFAIMNLLSEPHYNLSKYISSFHLVGVSLGGQGTFVTALLDEYNGQLVKSILDFCPLINLEQTFASHFSGTMQNAGIDLWNSHRLHSLYDHYPNELKGLQLWKTFFDLKPRFTPRVLQILDDERKTPLFSAEDLKKQIPKIIWPPGFYQLITQSKSFYQMNDFWKLYQNVRAPIKIFTTPKDFLVTNEVNSDLIGTKDFLGDVKNIKVEKLDRGIHCGLAPVYAWPDVVKMIKDGLGF